MKAMEIPSSLSEPEAALAEYLATLLEPSDSTGAGQDAQAEPATGREGSETEWRRSRLLVADDSRLLLPECRIEALLDARERIPAELPAPLCGILHHQGRRALCVDLADLMAPSGDPQAGPATRSVAVLIGRGRWALLCDSATAAGDIGQARVRWRRGQRGSRPWLAGISLPLRCGLLDADVLAEWLWRRLRGEAGQDPPSRMPPA